MNLSDQIKSVIRDVPDFPKKGIMFKDITPLLLDPLLCTRIVDGFAEKFESLNIDAIAAIEARGFFFGLMIAQRLKKPFIPIRKQGKLPYTTITKTYNLEYGTATLEMHQDAIQPGQNILIHDDLLATGGTGVAASQLIQELGGKVAGFSFIVDLTFLNGDEKLKPFSENIITLVDY